ncbi:hypothetical protein, partial [Vibrio lentus]|uniref:hypothetical protein n=1 Tax=Vibrio lentus TaxID=136468 RepID=UPI00197FDE50
GGSNPSSPTTLKKAVALFVIEGATAFLHFRIKIITWSTGSPDVQNKLFTDRIKESLLIE